MYAFLLGRQPLLSIAEILALCPESSVVALTEELMILDKVAADPERLLARLGGTIKLLELKKIEEQTPRLAILTELESAHFTSGKFQYAINAYGVPKAEHKIYLRSAKDYFKQSGISARFVNVEGKNTSSVQTDKNKLLQRGIELNVLLIEGIYYIGRTVAVQDFEAYSKRDYGKPVRDTKNGILPPKLAQILINLTGAKAEQVLYDPFCGSGTIPMEAMLMGVRPVASDQSPACIEQTKKNLAWLASKWPVERMAVEVTVRDATDQTIAWPEFDHLATEGYLGPNWEKAPLTTEITKVQSRILDLYTKFLAAIRPALSPTTRLVLCVPVWVNRGSKLYVEGWVEAFQTLGYSPTPLLPAAVAAKLDWPKDVLSLTYERPDQFVNREIWCLQIKQK